MAIIRIINEDGIPMPGPAPVVPNLDLDQYPMGAVPSVSDQLKDHLRRNWLKYLLAGGLTGGFFGYHANKKFNNYNVKLNQANMMQNAFNQMQNLHNELKSNYDNYSPSQRSQLLTAYKNLAAQLMPNQAAIISNFGDNHGDFLNFMEKSGRDIAANVVQNAKKESDKAADIANSSYFGALASKFGRGAKYFKDGRSDLEKASSTTSDLINQINQAGQNNLDKERQQLQDAVDQEAAKQATAQAVADSTNNNQPTDNNQSVDNNQSADNNQPVDGQPNNNQPVNLNQDDKTLTHFSNMNSDLIKKYWTQSTDKHGSYEDLIQLNDDFPELQKALLGTGKNGKVDPDNLELFNNILSNNASLNHLINNEDSDPHAIERVYRSLMTDYRTLNSRIPDFGNRIENLSGTIKGVLPEATQALSAQLNTLNHHYTNLPTNGITFDKDKEGQPIELPTPDQSRINNAVTNNLGEPGSTGNTPMDASATSTPTPPAQGAVDQSSSATPVQGAGDQSSPATPVQGAGAQSSPAPPVEDASKSESSINDKVRENLKPPVRRRVTKAPPRAFGVRNYGSTPNGGATPTVNAAPTVNADSTVNVAPVKATEGLDLSKTDYYLQNINELVSNFINEDQENSNSDNYTYSEPEENKEKESGSNSHLKTFGKILAAGGLAALGAGAIHQLKNSHLQNAQMYKNAKQKPQELNSLAKANTLNSVDLIQKVKEMKDKYMASRNQEESELEQK